jgi:hypothetical protein
MTNRRKLIPDERSCPCDAVSLRVIVNNHEAIDGNWSICCKKGCLYLIGSPEQFTLPRGGDVLTTYTLIPIQLNLLFAVSLYPIISIVFAPILIILMSGASLSILIS